MMAALDWFASFVAAADPILIGQHGFEIEGRGGDWAHWHRDGYCIAARLVSREETWAQVDATEGGDWATIPDDLYAQLAALGARLRDHSEDESSPDDLHLRARWENRPWWRRVLDSRHRFKRI